MNIMRNARWMELILQSTFVRLAVDQMLNEHREVLV